jgi:hypothetical protein
MCDVCAEFLDLLQSCKYVRKWGRGNVKGIMGRWLCVAGSTLDREFVVKYSANISLLFMFTVNRLRFFCICMYIGSNLLDYM